MYDRVERVATVKIYFGQAILVLTLAQLPEITDERMMFALKLMNTVAMNCFAFWAIAFRDTFAAVSLRMFYLTLRYGLSPLDSHLVIVSVWGVPCRFGTN
jgi:hypothetical protein